MKTILLPTDYSECARNAAKYAMAFFGYVDVRYILFHVHDMDTLQDIVSDETERKLKDEVDHLALLDHHDIAVIESKTGGGKVVNSIFRVCEAEAVDCIVMGTVGAKRPAWFGSNTTEVLMKSRCPVLVVPNGIKFKPPSQVVLPLNLKHAVSPGIFKLAYTFIKPHHPFLHIVTVINHTDSIQSDFHTDKIRDIIGDAPYSFTFVNDKSVVDGVTRFVEGLDADFMLLFPRKRSFLQYILNKSVSKKIAHYANLPMLSVECSYMSEEEE
jgi:nucleotide-binding universal stress UspA family protein